MITPIRIRHLVFYCLFSTFISAPLAMAATIGISIPLSGDAARLGQEFRLGAIMAMEKFGSEHQLVIADDGCDKQLAEQAVKELKTHNIAIITGLLCNEVALHMAETFRESNVPILVAGARALQLTQERNMHEWNLWQLSPTDASAANASAQTIAKLWRDKPFALLGDGLLYARNNLDSVNTYLSEQNLSPQIVKTIKFDLSDTHRLISTLQESQVSGAFVASTNTNDLISFVQTVQNSQSNIALLVNEQLATLPLMKRANALKPGFMVMKPAIPNSSFKIHLEQKLKEKNIIPSQNIYYGFSAIQIAIEALGNSFEETHSSLGKQQFKTILGDINFDETGANLNNPYRVHQWDGNAFIPIELN